VTNVAPNSNAYDASMKPRKEWRQQQHIGRQHVKIMLLTMAPPQHAAIGLFVLTGSNSKTQTDSGMSETVSIETEA